MILLSCLGLLPATATCSTTFLSYTGTLASPEDVFEVTFSVSSTDNLVIQTWGFGGGTNAAGAVIPAGGFDPLVALFSGPPATAAIFSVGGNPAADADNLSNPPFSYVGNCPPAGTVNIGTGAGSAVCGDDDLILSAVPAGIYTLVLTDANYVPSAVNPGPPSSVKLSDGFTDFTGGVFQTCNSVTNACITPTANFAVDIVDQSGADLNIAPEPGSGLVGIGLAVLGFARKLSKRNK